MLEFRAAAFWIDLVRGLSATKRHNDSWKSSCANGSQFIRERTFASWLAAWNHGATQGAYPTSLIVFRAW